MPPRFLSLRSLQSRFLAMLIAGLTLAFAPRAPAEDEPTPPDSLWTRPHLTPDWAGYRSKLEDLDLLFEVVYTGDFLDNTRGGIEQKGEYLGNLDMTLTWHTETLLGIDLGTLFLYGLYDHGGRPSSAVGDAQGVDNIEARDAAKFLEAWWQKSLFEDKASFLVGLYDVNSEFYAVDSAELFIHSSFGMGGELGTSGINGPSTFPTTSVGARFKTEPISGFEFQTALLDGVPGDPRRSTGTRIRFAEGDGVFWIAEVAHHRTKSHDHEGSQRPAQRRRVGRAWADRPNFMRVALGTWLYSAKQPHVSQTRPDGSPEKTRGHPGVYLIADFDATKLDPLTSGGLAVFLQLGFADGDAGQFAGYAGGGFKYTGLIPFRPEDEAGFAVAAAFNGDAFDRASRNQGQSPAVAEVAFEWTYRAFLTPWLSLQGDLQYVLNPGGLRDRPDSVVAGFRYVVDF